MQPEQLSHPNTWHVRLLVHAAADNLTVRSAPSARRHAKAEPNVGKPDRAMRSATPTRKCSSRRSSSRTCDRRQTRPPEMGRTCPAARPSWREHASAVPPVLPALITAPSVRNYRVSRKDRSLQIPGSGFGPAGATTCHSSMRANQCVREASCYCLAYILQASFGHCEMTSTWRSVQCLCHRMTILQRCADGERRNEAP